MTSAVPRPVRNVALALVAAMLLALAAPSSPARAHAGCVPSAAPTGVIHAVMNVVNVFSAVLNHSPDILVVDRDLPPGPITRVTHDITQLEQLRSRPVLRAPETMLESRSHHLWMQVSRGRDLIDRCVDAEHRRTGELRAAPATWATA